MHALYYETSKKNSCALHPEIEGVLEISESRKLRLGIEIKNW